MENKMFNELLKFEKERTKKTSLRFLFSVLSSWIFNPFRIRNEFSKLYPEKDAVVSLPLWHQFELKNPNTFQGMYHF
jgi:hypothetical protein